MKKRRTYPKSVNKRIRIDFWPPSLTIYEKTTQSGNIKSTAKMDVGPHKTKEPTIELKSRQEE